MHKLRFRQVHLDFHTSPVIENIGEKFNKKQWQQALRMGHINSITCFAKCHHGWSYHETKIGKRHPHLKFDLLRGQYDAAKELDINVPIYLSAGVDNLASCEHPEWREIGADGRYIGWTRDILDAGFHCMCFNSPYLNYLCEQIYEVVELFPEADGIFLDITTQGQCCCKWCLKAMTANTFDACIEADRKRCAELTMERYYREATIACKRVRKDMPVFHNSGHIQRGNREILKHFSHLELESLPTGGWGYDHFPLSAKYCKNLPYDYLGMTGKFHTTWGEFGGYKHPNALKYECSAMLAYGAKCSIGDQLHPSGEMDMSTYKMIGSVYEEVEAKEPWCENVKNVADIGLLSCEATNLMNITAQEVQEGVSSDAGVARILLEGHFLFDALDCDMNFSKYKILVLPDEVHIGSTLKTKLDDYLQGGGKLLLTGQSGLSMDNKGFVFDIGASWHGQSEFQPDYILPSKEYRPSFVDSPLVMYMRSQRIKVTSGKSLGHVHDPYFNRNYKHFCSHQHAPARPESSGFDCGVRNGNIIYLAHPVFSIYRAFGAVAYKEYIINVLQSLLDEPTINVNLPSTGRITLMNQKEHNRYVLHLLYANTINRGGGKNLSNVIALQSVEVIDELQSLNDVKVSLKVPAKVKNVICVPNGEKLDFMQKKDHIEFVLPRLQCHQIVDINFL
ncbi:MAG: alpha-amylase family protein [Sedimentisphaerales bacterium]